MQSDVQVVATDAQTGAQCPVNYDADRGWTRIELDGITKQGDENDRIERVRLQIQNGSDREQPVRLLLNKTQDLPITGMSAILRDQAGFPTGTPVQLSKNWHRSEHRRLTYEGPWFHGFTYLRLPARATAQLELVLVGAHWGGVAAASHAQLCLVGWGSNQLWDQSAMGSWGESFCFEPDRAQASALVCDVRPLMVHAMNQDTPTKWTWTNNVGGGDAFRLFATDGKYVRPTRMKTAYLRQGPCLTEVVYAGTLCGGAADHSVTTSLYRTDDMAPASIDCDWTSLDRWTTHALWSFRLVPTPTGTRVSARWLSVTRPVWYANGVRSGAVTVIVRHPCCSTDEYPGCRCMTQSRAIFLGPVRGPIAVS